MLEKLFTSASQCHWANVEWTEVFIIFDCYISQFGVARLLVCNHLAQVLRADVAAASPGPRCQRSASVPPSVPSGSDLPDSPSLPGGAIAHVRVLPVVPRLPGLRLRAAGGAGREPGTVPGGGGCA
jgi:hypothetical protein